MRFANRADAAQQHTTLAPMPYTCSSFTGMPSFGFPQASQMPMQMPAMPTGFPTGGTATPLLPSQTGVPAIPLSEQPPATLQSRLYTPGYLRSQIGKKMRVEFLIGTGTLVDRTGTLVGVGASYILLQLVETDDIMMCDIYSIKFATIFY